METIYAKTRRSIRCTANVTGITDFTGYTAYLTAVSVNDRNTKVIDLESDDWDSNSVVFDLDADDLDLEYVQHDFEFAISNTTNPQVIARTSYMIAKSLTFAT